MAKKQLKKYLDLALIVYLIMLIIAVILFWLALR